MLKKLITTTLFASAVVTLFSLSWWQVQRLNWKEDVIARLEAQYNQPVAPVLTFQDLNLLQDQDAPLLYGKISGKLLHAKEILWGPKPLDGDIGYNIITPLQLATGEYVLVNRGWGDQKQKAAIKDTLSSSKLTITGLFRKPDWNIFTPNNSPENDIWMKPDIAEIAQVKSLNPVAPVMLYADKISVQFDGITLQDQKWHPRNKHKQYAIFWFIMGVAFISVFGLFKHRQARQD